MWQLDASQKQELIALLKQLVAIPSVNLGPDRARIDKPERHIARFIALYLRDQIGMKVKKVMLEPARPNLIGTWPISRGMMGRTGRTGKPAGGADKSLMLTAHMDTVNVEGMTVEPFDARCRDGRIYGRGTCDTKGSIAVFLYVLKLLRQFGWKFDRRILFVGTAGEENGCDGAKSLVASGFKADQAIIGEPTACQVAIAHKASMRAELLCLGRSAHASMPQEGTNAIYLMCRAIEQLRTRLTDRFKVVDHRLLKKPTIAATMIDGGRRYNMVPDRCTAVLDLRLVPGQGRDDVLEQMRAVLAEQMPRDSFGIENVEFNPGLDTDASEPLVRQLVDARAAVCGSAEPIGVEYFADSGPFAAGGTTCVVFGPGHGAQAHGPAEFVTAEQLFCAVEILMQFFGGIKL